MTAAHPPDADLIGTMLGEYQIVSRIGLGGMGVVYEGRHPLIGKRVAVKVLTAQASSELDAVDRFLAEARAVNAIRHRGIVDIFGFGKLPTGAQYFVMELLEGLPFDELIRQRAPVNPGDALRWIDEVLDALDAAHHTGVIHRDIKPSNLFLVDTGRGQPYVKLLDFGVAKLAIGHGQSTPQTNVRAVVGTPDYMAPEQARGRPISGQTDLYALGCVLYELLTGKRIFVRDGALEVMLAHVDEAPTRPSKLDGRIPAAVDELVLRLVAKKPASRPENARKAREEVHAVLLALGEPASLPGPSNRSLQVARTPTLTDSQQIGPTLVVPRTQASLRHRPVARLGLISGAVVVVAGAFAGAFFWPRSSVERVERPLPPAVEATLDAGPATVAAVRVEAPPVADAGPTGVAAARVEAPPVADAGAAVNPVSEQTVRTGVVKPLVRPGPRSDGLPARLVRLKVQLDAWDKKKGERDRILHRLLDGAEKDLAAARTPEQRKAVAAQFDDLQAQLRP